MFLLWPVLHVPSHTTDRIFFSISHHPPPRGNCAPFYPSNIGGKKAPGKYRHHPCGPTLFPRLCRRTHAHVHAHVHRALLTKKERRIRSESGGGWRGVWGDGKNSSKIAHGAGDVIHHGFFFHRQRAHFEKISPRLGHARGRGRRMPDGWLTLYGEGSRWGTTLILEALGDRGEGNRKTSALSGNRRIGGRVELKVNGAFKFYPWGLRNSLRSIEFSMENFFKIQVSRFIWLYF